MWAKARAELRLRDPDGLAAVGGTVGSAMAHVATASHSFFALVPNISAGKLLETFIEDARQLFPEGTLFAAASWDCPAQGAAALAIFAPQDTSWLRKCSDLVFDEFCKLGCSTCSQSKQSGAEPMASSSLAHLAYNPAPDAPAGDLAHAVLGLSTRDFDFDLFSQCLARESRFANLDVGRCREIALSFIESMELAAACDCSPGAARPAPPRL